MMATRSRSSSDDGALFGGLEWMISPVTFHRNTGKNIELTESNTVANRVSQMDLGKSLVFTSEPLAVGQMLKVTITKRRSWYGGMVSHHLVCAMLAWLSLSQ